MKQLILCASLLVGIAPSSVAQVPIVQVYLDSELLTIHRECAPLGTPDTLYVVASNFTQPILDIEYRIETYGNLLIAEDLLPEGFTGEGYSGSGIRVLFGTPLDASARIVVERLYVLWTCNNSCSGSPLYLTVQPHPQSGRIQATRWPDLVKLDALGGFNSFCGVLPVTSSTWGQIKALYR